ncbi:hypothetical protein N7G274_010634 [Stereocaulon virgatum]|uniref:Rhodopsin domain-containing protein n=1 Tax=Stereocaulon virgatum TaxID=373712 RepID=A0ABR3ZZV9_9LECA
MVWKLQVTFEQKMALSGVFLMGGVGLIASAVRMSIFFRHNAFLDRTWTSVQLLSWGVIECGMILVAACLPTLMPVFHSIGSAFQRGYSHSSGSNKTRKPSVEDSFTSWRTKRVPNNSRDQGFARISSQGHLLQDRSNLEAEVVPLNTLPATPPSSYHWAVPKGS